MSAPAAGRTQGGGRRVALPWAIQQPWAHPHKITLGAAPLSLAQPQMRGHREPRAQHAAVPLSVSARGGLTLVFVLGMLTAGLGRQALRLLLGLQVTSSHNTPVE